MEVKGPRDRKPGAAAPGASLLDRILAPANLAQAWEDVAANEGIPGADRVSIARFSRNWEERVIRLAAEVRAGSYRPGRLRVIFIPKARTSAPRKCAGTSLPRTLGEGEAGAAFRRITIPTVADRVLQRATLQVLMPRFDRKFLSCSYGYRPKRGVAQAVAAVIRYRDRGLRYAAEADIDDCFGSLDHAILLELLQREVPDEKVMGLMRAWLDGAKTGDGGTRRHAPIPGSGTGSEREAETTELAGRTEAACAPRSGEGAGIALGLPISPLWANLYLHEMDWRLVRNRWSLVRYADDFVVLVSSPRAGEHALEAAARALDDLKLRLEPTKTRVSSFEDGFTFLGVHFRGDEYTFSWQQKRITVEGKFEWLWGEYMTYQY